MLRKYGKWIAIGLVAAYIIGYPANAANIANNAFSGLGDAGNSLATFVNKLDFG